MRWGSHSPRVPGLALLETSAAFLRSWSISVGLLAIWRFISRFRLSFFSVFTVFFGRLLLPRPVCCSWLHSCLFRFTFASMVVFHPHRYGFVSLPSCGSCVFPLHGLGSGVFHIVDRGLGLFQFRLYPD